MLKGFKNFLMRGDVVTVAVGLVVALAFSTLVKAFTTYVINPLVASAQPGMRFGLGWQLGAPGNKSTFLDIGQFISAVIYFFVFMAVVYFVIVVPYRMVQSRRGVTVFADPEPAAPTKTCPACLSDDLPEAATKCKHCATEQPVESSSGTEW